MAAPPGDPLAFADLEEKLELFLEELVVVREVIPEQRERLGERAAARHDLGAAVRDEVERGEALKHSDGVVRADDADRARETDALGARRGGGEHDGRCGDDELAAVMLAQAVHVEADPVGQLDLVKKPPNTLVRADRSSGLGIGRCLAEAVDPELHGS